jgi:hypothetical protein
MGTITRSFANLITATGPSAIADGSIVNADINSSAAIAYSKLNLGSSIISSDLSNTFAYFRNLIINGDMKFAQRSTSVANAGSAAGLYQTLDRYIFLNYNLGSFTWSQSSDVPTGEGFANSMKFDCTTADASPAYGDYLLFQQRFEGQNLQYLRKGTANALPLTLSFFVKSTKTGTFCVELYDYPNDRSISRTYTVNSSNTWEYKTVNFVADTQGTLNNDNSYRFSVDFWLATGEGYSSGSLQTSWGPRVQINRAVGQVNIADSTANDWLITGLQLEAGTQASAFEFLPADINLIRCQRYYESPNTDVYIGHWNAAETYILRPHFAFNTSKRTSPSMTFSGALPAGTNTAIINSYPQGFTAEISGATNTDYRPFFQWTANADL